jgi:hypothetical protein
MPFNFRGQPLVGKSNYIEWKTQADLYLEINGYIPYINGTKLGPDKALYYTTAKGEETPYSPETAIKYSERLAEYNDNQLKALGALKSIISIDNIERFKSAKTAYNLYKAITETYGSKSFEQIGYYLDRINYTSYNESKSMDSYTSTIQASYYALKELENEVPKANIAWNILKGLPSSYDPLISRKYEEISKSISDKEDIDLNKLITDLISEEARMQSFIKDDKAYITRSNQVSNRANNSRPNKANRKHCKYCNKLGHLEQQCFKKNPELAPDKPRNQEGNKKEINKDRSSLLYTSTTTIHPNYSRPTEIGPYFILDSGATEHWTPNKEWLEDYTPERKTVYLANNATTEALGYGNIDIQVYNDKTKAKSPITISKVYYIPNITTNLLSIKRILDKG